MLFYSTKNGFSQIVFVAICTGGYESHEKRKDTGCRNVRFFRGNERIIHNIKIETETV